MFFFMIEYLSVDQILKILPLHIKIESAALISQLEVLKNDKYNKNKD